MMPEAIGIIEILILGLAVIIRVYTSKRVPGVIKGILWFLAIFGVGDGLYLLTTWQYPILFHLWSTGILFIFILLVIAGI